MIKKQDSASIEQNCYGLISAHHGVEVEVVFTNGKRRMVRVKRNSGHVVGDDVKLVGGVLHRLPRRTELSRRDITGGVHLLASNLDALGIVVSLHSPLGFIDRAVVAARTANLQPFLVVNKSDLDDTLKLYAELAEIYGGSIPLFSVSAINMSGLEPLKSYLSAGLRVVFAGASGVGKSSLLNALCPAINLKVGSVSDYKYQGRHTTTVSTLHSLPEGGELVDTPGFKDFGMVQIFAEELAAHFPGFEEHGTANCRFRNCRHRTEPGCTIINLVKSGDITSERYAIYLELLNEVETQQSEARCREWKN